jgi:hypothetical protein
VAGVTHTIGFTVDLSKGTFNNTVFDEEMNVLRLLEVAEDESGNTVYSNSGDWISDVIDLKGSFTEFNNLIKSVALSGSYKIFTRTSSDSEVWDDWEEISESNDIVSEPKRYIQLKVEIYGQLSDSTFVLDDFNGSAEFDNAYVNYDSGVLELKKVYERDMTIDDSWTEDGYLFRKKILIDEFKKINSLKLIP